MKQHSKLSRRNFLLSVGAGSAAAATAIIAKKADAPQPADTSKRATRGYQETAHTANYYRTAKI